ncbi:GNAT family N-acetyltransferase [Herbiconiux sp. KACC 21604]|uniref:GNAT family N-acetyltransferase n=1 Tax=unclassified Herbiconiux TaxID=2618217 RepID=UPI001492D3F6|nr:GNAT family N-acetyltransferase [Herbiconiux sp. SALV-R1]QJU52997.1 GNAT family N-acetyltransferase [Herbiconiux sp. SALV-R1]WPO87928.1 GNAT family N-acetyltransferase [Herbiconiux sp. KACC 21604]
MPIEVRPVGTGEFFPWHAVYTGYGEFYETPLHDEKAVLVWSWIIDPSNELECLVAVEPGDDGGEIVGLAHFREFARPLEGNRGIYLDDLFVLPEKRTSGVGRALIEGVYAVGRERGIAVVTWITAKDNDTARKLYDQVAEKTKWVTYEKAL